MSLLQGFTRRETMELTGATSNQLQYLERANLVVALKIKEGRIQPKVWYTWSQILEIKIIRSLRENTSLQTIRKVLDLFKIHEDQKSFCNKRIIAIDDEVFWVKQDLSDLPQALASLKIAKSSNRGIGQFTLTVLPSINEVEHEIFDISKKSKTIDLKAVKEKQTNNLEMVTC